jgi:hypothetical protein
MSKKFKTSITLDNELIDRIKAEARRHRWSVSQLMQIAIEDWLIAVSETDPKDGRNDAQ